ncbi:MAG: hypothetical protein Kow0062_05840 [Acidobacteriota bacterium]
MAARRGLIARLFGGRERARRDASPSWAPPSVERILALTEGMVEPRESALLHRLARETREGCIVEVGSYRGRSASLLGAGSLAGARRPVYAVDPHAEFRGLLGGEFGPQDREAFYRAMLATGCWRIVRLVNLSSEVVTPGWTEPVGLLFLDGDHSLEGVRRDFGCWREHLLAGARVAFDDASDPDLGPWRLIEELVSGGDWRRIEQVGRITVLGRA